MNLDLITRRFKLFLSISILALLGLGAFAPFVKTANTVDVFALKEHPDQKFYDKFKEIFGNDEFFVIAFRKGDLFTRDNLALLQQLTSDLESMDLAREVVSLANVDDIAGTEDAFVVKPFLQDLPETRGGMENLRREAVDNPLYAGNLISRDGTTAGIVVFAHDRPQDQGYRASLLEQTGRILKPYRDQADFHLAGSTVTNHELSQSMQEDLATFIPLTYLLIAAVTFAFFRNVRLTLLAVLTITAVLSSTMGLSALLGIPTNNVTTVIPPLVMAMTLTTIVHIFTHMQRPVLEAFPDRGRAMGHVLSQVAAPCLLTALTTAAGFLSLSFSDLEPIRQFAVLAPAGILLGFFYSFFMLPPLLVLLDPVKIYGPAREGQMLSRALLGLARWVGSHKVWIIGGSAVVVAAALFFAGRIKVENNLVEFFRPSSPERQALHFVEKNLSGVASMDISVKARKRDAFKEPHNLAVLEKLENFVSGLPGVDVVLSFNHFVKDMHMSFHNEKETYYKIPDSRQLISQYLLLYDSDDINDFVNSDFDHARLLIRLGVHSSSAKAGVIRKIQEQIQSLQAPGLTVRVTGQAVQEVNIIDTLVEGQVQSLGIAVGVISVLMFAVFRSMSLGLLSLVPNCFPIVLNFGLMGMFGIPLNTATSLIAAVAVGIAVDDTIHFLHRFNARRRLNAPVGAAVQEAMTVKGRAMTCSSVILCTGFGVLLLSGFMPVVYFGVLSAVIMITALVGDLVVLPALLMSRSRT